MIAGTLQSDGTVANVTHRSPGPGDVAITAMPSGFGPWKPCDGTCGSGCGPDVRHAVPFTPPPTPATVVRPANLDLACAVLACPASTATQRAWALPIVQAAVANLAAVIA